MRRTAGAARGRRTPAEAAVAAAVGACRARSAGRAFQRDVDEKGGQNKKGEEEAAVELSSVKVGG